MRKHTKRRRITPKAPMCVVLSQTPELGITEHQSVVAIAGGWATTDHFDNLADCRNIMTLAAAERNDEQTLIVCELRVPGLVTQDRGRDFETITNYYEIARDYHAPANMLFHGGNDERYQIWAIHPGRVGGSQIPDPGVQHLGRIHRQARHTGPGHPRAGDSICLQVRPT